METQAKKNTALITGACSGIGLAIGRELAGRGYNLVMVSNRETPLGEACELMVSEFGICAWPVFIDLAKPDAAEKLYEWCLQKEIVVDVLVNNAGVFFFEEVSKTDPDRAFNMMQLHTTTPALLCLLFGKEMKQRRSGHILIISSLAANMPYPGLVFYSATKRFLQSFSRALRTEMIDYNVNVTCVLPGAVSTQLYTLSASDQKKALRSGIMMQPDQLARKAVNALLKRRARLVPGAINRIALVFLRLIPHGLVRLAMRHSRLLPPDKR